MISSFYKKSLFRPAILDYCLRTTTDSIKLKYSNIQPYLYNKNKIVNPFELTMSSPSRPNHVLLGILFSFSIYIFYYNKCKYAPLTKHGSL